MTKNLYYEIEIVDSSEGPVPTLYHEGKHITEQDILKFNKDKDNMKKHEYYVLRFTIRNFKDSLLRFVPDVDDMFWAQVGTTCPTKRCSIPGVLWVSDHDKKGEWIEVTNADMSPLAFWFTLNFARKTLSDPAPSDYVPLDPGGLNQNGGIGGRSESYLVAGLVGGVAAGATALLVNNALAPVSVLTYVVAGAVFGLVVGAIAARL